MEVACGRLYPLQLPDYNFKDLCPRGLFPHAPKWFAASSSSLLDTSPASLMTRPSPFPLFTSEFLRLQGFIFSPFLPLCACPE